MQAPFADGRPAGSALYFMLTPEEPVKLHRIRNDQLYHYYLGDPIEVLMLLESGFAERHIVGPDLRKGHRVQLYIPGNIFHTARVIGGRRWFLGAPRQNGPASSLRMSSLATRMRWRPDIQASLTRFGAFRCQRSNKAGPSPSASPSSH
jgi:hypothetical protein